MESTVATVALCVCVWGGGGEKEGFNDSMTFWFDHTNTIVLYT